MLEKFRQSGMVQRLFEWGTFLTTAFIVFWVIHMFVFVNANINGNSMEPTLSHGDKVLVTQFSYWFSDPAYYDIIAFPFKENPGEHYIKRIIGLPGDEVDLVNYHFTVNGQSLPNDLFSEQIYALGDVAFPITVPANSYFVLGDNRNETKDSRYQSVGCISKKDIMGKASFRVWPLKKIGFLGGK